MLDNLDLLQVRKCVDTRKKYSEASRLKRARNVLNTLQESETQSAIVCLSIKKLYWILGKLEMCSWIHENQDQTTRRRRRVTKRKVRLYTRIKGYAPRAG